MGDIMKLALDQCQADKENAIRKLNALEAEAYYLGQAKNILFDAIKRIHQQGVNDATMSWMIANVALEDFRNLAENYIKRNPNIPTIGKVKSRPE